MGKCILFCAGDFTLMQVKPAEGDLIIAVDAGLQYCKMLELSPDYIIGDFDSADEEDLAWINEWEAAHPGCVLTLPCEKDDSDTMAAVRLGLSLGYLDFRIYGAVGGRIDHYFANIQVLNFIKHQGGTGYLLDGTGMILIAENEEIAFREEMEGIISVFSLVAASRGVTIRGMKYEVENATITNDFPIGLSNTFIGKASSIAVENGTLVCMIQY